MSDIDQFPPTPDERDITKMQLWERINSVLDTLGTVGRNMADNLAAALPAMQRETQLGLAEFKATLKDATDDMQDFVNIQVKFLEKMNNDAYGRQVNEGNRIRADIDARFQSLKADMEAETGQRIADSFAQITDSIKKYSETVDEYRTASLAQVTNLQQEMGKKLGDVTASFDLMKKKFQKISEQLQ